MHVEGTIVVPKRRESKRVSLERQIIFFYFQKVPPDLRFHVLASFNAMESKDKQDQYLSGNVVAVDPNRVGAQGRGGKFSETNRGRRTTTYKYFIPTGNLFHCLLIKG